MRKITRLLLFLASVTLISCATIPDHLPGVYRLDIQQGNIIDQDMIDQLRPNMTKRQVLYILGSPMLIDVFHQKRWDYIYSEQLGAKDRKQQRITLYFEGDTLTGVQGDYRPSTLAIAKVNTDTTVNVPKRKEKKTVFGEIAKLFSFDDEAEQDKSEDKAIDTDKTEPKLQQQDNKEKNPTDEVEQPTISEEKPIQSTTSESHPATEQQVDSAKETAIENDLDNQTASENPEIDQNISKETPKTENQVIEAVTPDKPTAEKSIISEPSAPEQQPEKLEDVEVKDPEDTFSKQLEELTKPPILEKNE